MFINNYKDEQFSSKPYYISSCTHFGVDEKIFSNRTEYYICGNYYSSSLDDKLIIYIKLINKIILEDMDSEELYNFIESDKKIAILPYDTFYNMPQNMLICGSCNSKIITVENQFDFCDKKLCDECQHSSDYSFHYCNTYETKWCDVDVKYRSGNCEKCGF